VSICRSLKTNVKTFNDKLSQEYQQSRLCHSVVPEPTDLYFTTAKLDFSNSQSGKSMRGETVGSCVHPVSTDLLDFDLNCKNTERRSQKHTDSLAFANDADSTHNVDLLDDIFVEKTMAAQSENAVEEPEQTQMQASFKAFEKGGLTLTMVLSKDQLDPKIMEITCNFFNHTITDFNHLVFQAAVPKYVLMELKPASAMTIPANSNWIVTQIIKVLYLDSIKNAMINP